MLIDIPVLANLITIQNKRQELIDENLRRQNQKRREHHYQAGQQVLLKSVKPNKLEARAHGPYPIIQAYTNGTVDIARNNHVLQRVNIRRIIPYKQ